MPKVSAQAIATHVLPAAPVVAPATISIAALCAASWSAVVSAMRNGQHWSDYRLNQAMLDGHIKLMPLGPELKVNGVEYPIEELAVPTTWTFNDERKNNTKHARIELVKCLLENTVNSHEDMLAFKLENFNLIISEDYRTHKHDTQQVPGQTASYFLSTTAVAFIPKDIDLNTADIWTGNTNG